LTFASLYWITSKDCRFSFLSPFYFLMQLIWRRLQFSWKTAIESKQGVWNVSKVECKVFCSFPKCARLTGWELESYSSLWYSGCIAQLSTYKSHICGSLWTAREEYKGSRCCSRVDGTVIRGGRGSEDNVLDAKEPHCLL
jgi:hypothetical protein